MLIIHLSFLAKIFAHAEEDELDDVVDIEGEDNQVVGDDIVEDDDSVVKSSQDVDTTILFTKPVPNYGDNAFGMYSLNYFLCCYRYSLEVIINLLLSINLCDVQK